MITSDPIVDDTDQACKRFAFNSATDLGWTGSARQMLSRLGSLYDGPENMLYWFYYSAFKAADTYFGQTGNIYTRALFITNVNNEDRACNVGFKIYGSGFVAQEELINFNYRNFQRMKISKLNRYEISLLYELMWIHGVISMWGSFLCSSSIHVKCTYFSYCLFS